MSKYWVIERPEWVPWSGAIGISYGDEEIAWMTSGGDEHGHALRLVGAANALEATERLVEECEAALKAFVAAIDRAIADDDVSIVDEITDEIENDARAALASIADWRKP